VRDGKPRIIARDQIIEISRLVLVDQDHLEVVEGLRAQRVE
jgi:hypothetical protein